MKFFLLLLEQKHLISNKAFTLIELVVAIAIILVIATIGITSYRYHKAQILAAESQKLYLNIINLQQKAVATGSEIALTFRNNNSYYFENRNENLNKNIKFGFLKNAYGPPAQPTSLITKAITFKNEQIRFEPSGNISSGTVYLVDNSEKFMYAITIGVAKKIYVRIYKFISSKWQLVN